MGHGNFRKWGLPFIALGGALIALVVVFWSQRKVPTPPILFPPPTSPYVSSIAGAGIIEASSLNISIGTPFTQIVTKVFVKEGDKVKLGDPLFRIDIRSLEAQARAAFASVQLALVTVEDKKTQVSFYERLHDKTSASEQAYSQTVYALKEAQENYNVAVANYAAVLTDIEKSTITSPLDAFILQVNTAVGEIAITQTIPQAPTVSFSTTQAPLILLGSILPPHIRIDVDENDAWRYSCGARATAFVRGNSNIHFPLKFVRVEPYIIPKVSFTGATSERIDTRVLQLIYAFEWCDYPIYVGQILDIFIEAEPFSSSSTYTGWQSVLPSQGHEESRPASQCGVVSGLILKDTKQSPQVLR